MTKLIVTEIADRGRFSVGGFLVRRIRRLLPAAAVTLVAICLLTWLFHPRGRWTSIGWDVVTAAFYGVNWRMAEQSVDYLAANSAPSPVQHFWSLAVEEQFYLLWPLLLVGAVWLVRNRLLRLRGAVLAVLLGVVMSSLAWSIFMSTAAPERAYFVTPTRLWELALAGLAVVLAPSFSRLPRAAAASLGWVGLVTIVASAVLIDRSTTFPGMVAAVPTVATLVVVLVGARAGCAGRGVVLTRRPMTFVGDLSYSLYLWRWPLLVVAAVIVGGGTGRSLTGAEGLVVVVLSGIPAWLSFRYVEERFRRPMAAPNSFAGAVAQGGMMSGVAMPCGLGLLFAVWPPAPPPDGGANVVAALGEPGVDRARPKGAEVLGPHPDGNPAGRPVDRVDQIVRDPIYAKEDSPGVGCHQDQEHSAPTSCRFGAANPRGVIALVGDSTALQFQPAFAVMATQSGWVLDTYTKSSCPFTSVLVALQGRPYDDCQVWRRLVQKRQLASPPDVVVTTSSAYVVLDNLNGKPLLADQAEAAMIDRVHKLWQPLIEAGSQIVVMPSTPVLPFDPAECVDQRRDHMTECTAPRTEALMGRGARVQKAADYPGVGIVEINKAICPAEQCAPVIGGVLVYRDRVHITATYAATLAGHLRAAFRPYLSTASGQASENDQNGERR